MIEYDNKNESGVIQCDTCGEAEEFNGDFAQVVENAKAVGWLCVKVGTYYEHYCHNCK